MHYKIKISALCECTMKVVFFFLSSSSLQFSIFHANAFRFHEQERLLNVRCYFIPCELGTEKLRYYELQTIFKITLDRSCTLKGIKSFSVLCSPFFFLFLFLFFFNSSEQQWVLALRFRLHRLLLTQELHVLDARKGNEILTQNMEFGLGKCSVVT